jgi:hypothetical protein
VQRRFYKARSFGGLMEILIKDFASNCSLNYFEVSLNKAMRLINQTFKFLALLNLIVDFCIKLEGTQFVFPPIT